MYLSERKRKKARYNEATHKRHDQLLQDCLRKFFIYTDHTRQRRQALFIHQQVYVSFQEIIIELFNDEFRIILFSSSIMIVMLWL